MKATWNRLDRGDGWGVRVYDRNGAKGLEGQTVEVTARNGRTKRVELGQRIAGYNGGTVAVYRTKAEEDRQAEEARQRFADADKPARWLRQVRDANGDLIGVWEVRTTANGKRGYGKNPERYVVGVVRRVQEGGPTEAYVAYAYGETLGVRPTLLEAAEAVMEAFAEHNRRAAEDMERFYAGSNWTGD